jgi:hypothetical protein
LGIGGHRFSFLAGLGTCLTCRQPWKVGGRWGVLDVANIGDRLSRVNWIGSLFLAMRATPGAMARRKSETLADLLKPIRDADRFTSWCETVAHVRPWTVLRLIDGKSSRWHRGTVLAIVAGLAAEGIKADEPRVRSAIEASRAAAKD